MNNGQILLAGLVDILQKLAEEELGEYPFEVLEESLEKPLEEQEDDYYCVLDSLTFKLAVDELYERSMWHFEQREEKREVE